MTTANSISIHSRILEGRLLPVSASHSAISASEVSGAALEREMRLSANPEANLEAIDDRAA